MFRLLLSLSFLVGSSTSTGDDFAKPLPGDLPDVSGWERITGDVETERLEATYLLYVNPQLQALYQVMRYRVRLLSPTTDAERQYRSSEKLIWNEKPGRVLVRCFELVSAPGGAAPGTLPTWREISHGTTEYDTEMRMGMELLGLHRRALHEREQR